MIAKEPYDWILAEKLKEPILSSCLCDTDVVEGVNKLADPKRASALPFKGSETRSRPENSLAIDHVDGHEPLWKTRA